MLKRVSEALPLPSYAKRILDYDQMDFEYSLTQMKYLLFAPSKVYKLTSWRNHTKFQWARDAPVFLILLVLLIGLVSVSNSLFVSVNGLILWGMNDSAQFRSIQAAMISFIDEVPVFFAFHRLEAILFRLVFNEMIFPMSAVSKGITTVPKQLKSLKIINCLPSLAFSS